ncbi:anti-sigma factor family protein [Roseibium litorale]|uniref:Zf-HC2 domain-containing protein n=1 Tax=Roseibium litorale TaxID=2803841 RepID=A0ABR9CKC6_9HYPH|nr:zf-HC2 domain-containing protein [Roseibium litorale]MBD8891305.1 zf-HC2 domain-containing protein [Roseibium litorale]
MLDSSPPISAEPHDAVWELIPWFVNGTLPASEQAKVKQHIQSCPQCAAEVARQFKLAKRVATEDPFDVPLSRSWSHLRDQIEAEARAGGKQVASAAGGGIGAAGRSTARRRSGSQRGRSTFGSYRGFGGAALVAGAGIAACLVAAIVILPDYYGPQNREGYQTLTNGASPDSNNIKFQTKSALSQEALSALLDRHGMKLESGPSESGVYTASFNRTGAQSGDRKTAAEELMSDPEILFASPE